MGIHILGVVKAKIMVMAAHSTSPAPMVGVVGLVFPFVLKMSFSLSLVRKTYWDLLHSSRLFFFQLSHIAFNTDPINEHNTTTRFERALRLVYERLTHFRTSAHHALPNSQEDTLHSLSMLAL